MMPKVKIMHLVAAAKEYKMYNMKHTSNSNSEGVGEQQT